MASKPITSVTHLFFWRSLCRVHLPSLYSTHVKVSLSSKSAGDSVRHIRMDSFTIEEEKQVRRRLTIRALVFNGNCRHAQCKIKHACTNESCMKLNVFKFMSHKHKVYLIKSLASDMQVKIFNYPKTIGFQCSSLESVNVLHRGEGMRFSNARLPWLQLPPSSLKCLFLSQDEHKVSALFLRSEQTHCSTVRQCDLVKYGRRSGPGVHSASALIKHVFYLLYESENKTPPVI